MTEGEWLNCTDPTQMLEFLGGKGGDVLTSGGGWDKHEPT